MPETEVGSQKFVVMEKQGGQWVSITHGTVAYCNLVALDMVRAGCDVHVLPEERARYVEESQRRMAEALREEEAMRLLEAQEKEDETMTTLTTDVAHLLAALDACDDSVLPILADAIDCPAFGRHTVERGRKPCRFSEDGGWEWMRDADLLAYSFIVPARVFDRLAGGTANRNSMGEFKVYPTRSAAFLALAEAFSQGDST